MKLSEHTAEEWTFCKELDLWPSADFEDSQIQACARQDARSLLTALVKETAGVVSNYLFTFSPPIPNNKGAAVFPCCSFFSGFSKYFNF